MSRSVLSLLLASTMLSGCGETWLNARLNYVEGPTGGMEDKTCAELKGVIASASKQIQQLEELTAKMAEEWPGAFIGWASYGPDLDKARAMRFAAREVQVRKRCEGSEVPG